MKNTLKPSEKFDEVYNKGKGRMEVVLPLTKYHLKQAILKIKKLFKGG